MERITRVHSDTHVKGSRDPCPAIILAESNLPQRPELRSVLDPPELRLKDIPVIRVVQPSLYLRYAALPANSVKHVSHKLQVHWLVDLQVLHSVLGDDARHTIGVSRQQNNHFVNADPSSTFLFEKRHGHCGADETGGHPGDDVQRVDVVTADRHVQREWDATALVPEIRDS